MRGRPVDGSFAATAGILAMTQVQHSDASRRCRSTTGNRIARARKKFCYSLPDARPSPRCRRQRSEQYRTSSHTRAHFRRQAKGRPQAAQVFAGRSALRRMRPGVTARSSRARPGPAVGGAPASRAAVRRREATV